MKNILSLILAISLVFPLPLLAGPLEDAHYREGLCK